MSEIPYEIIGFWLVHLAGFAALLWLLYYVGIYSGWILIEFLHWFGKQGKVKKYPTIGGLELYKIGPTFPNGSQSRNIGLWLTWTDKPNRTEV